MSDHNNPLLPHHFEPNDDSMGSGSSSEKFGPDSSGDNSTGSMHVTNDRPRTLVPPPTYHIYDEGDTDYYSCASDTGSPIPSSNSPSRIAIAAMQRQELPTQDPKKRFLGRIFSRKVRQEEEAKRKSEQRGTIENPPPSYRDAEIAEAWAKLGINVNDRKHGPRPQCTPEEWLKAMDGLFGLPLPHGELRNGSQSLDSQRARGATNLASWSSRDTNTSSATCAGSIHDRIRASGWA